MKMTRYAEVREEGIVLIFRFKKNIMFRKEEGCIIFEPSNIARIFETTKDDAYRIAKHIRIPLPEGVEIISWSEILCPSDKEIIKETTRVVIDSFRLLKEKMERESITNWIKKEMDFEV